MIVKAARFAKLAHTNQVRKFSGVPYIIHPIRVAGRAATLDEANADLVSAAWLHDVIEDCGVTKETLAREFNPNVANIVDELTNRFTKEAYPDWNRDNRKRAEEARIAGISQSAKIIKLIDRIDNFADIPDDDSFKARYADETAALLEVLTGVNPELEEELKQLLAEFYGTWCKNFI